MSHLRAPQLHVIRIGPDEIDGEHEHLYYAWGSGEGTLKFASSDEDGLVQLIAATPGRALRCEPRLAEIGRRFQLPSGVPPQAAYLNAACLALLAVMGGLAPDLAGRKVLIEASAAFVRSRPWIHWKEIWRPDREIHVRIEGPLETFTSLVLVRGDTQKTSPQRGFYLLHEPDVAEHFVQLLQAKKDDEIAKLPGLHVLFSEEPAWASDLIARGLGAKGNVPLALRTSPNGLRPCSAVDAVMLAATAMALAKLDATERKALVTLETGIGPVKAKLVRT